MKKRQGLWILSMLLILASKPLQSQIADTAKIKKFKTVITFKKVPQNWPLEVGYFTPFIFHSGITVSTPFVYKERHITVNRMRLLRWAGINIKPRKREKIQFRTIELGTSLFKQKEFMTGALLNIKGKYTKQRYKGFQYFTSAGIGYMRIWYPGKVYAVKDDGTIKEKNLGTRGYICPELGIGIGWNMENWKRLKNPGTLRISSVASYPLNYGSSASFMNFNSLTYTFKINKFSQFINNKIKK